VELRDAERETGDKEAKSRDYARETLGAAMSVKLDVIHALEKYLAPRR
jgi:hypothetical protein